MFSRAFFKDRLILLQAFIASLLTGLSLLLATWQVDTSVPSAVLRYWTIQGVPEFDKQPAIELYSFSVLAVIVLALALVMSYNLYNLYKPAAYATWFLSNTILLATLLTSNAILSLQ